MKILTQHVTRKDSIFSPKEKAPEIMKRWGSEHIFTNGSEGHLYCMKILVIKPGEKTSFHLHLRKAETICVAQGTLKLHIEDHAYQLPVTSFILEQNQAVRLDPGDIHCLENIGTEDLILFEASTVDDGDSIRTKAI